MSGLLRADFRRVMKDKLLLIMGILAAGFALIMPLLYYVLFSAMDVPQDDMVAGMVAGYMSGKTLFFGAFSSGSNFGLIAPVLLAIVLRKDFSYGTIRNKIIAGKSRSQIFLSLFTTCSVVLIGVMMLHAFITLGISLILFDYQTAPFTAADFWYFLASLGFEVLVLLFMSSLLSWLCTCMKNVGLVIVLYVAFMFFLVLTGSILQVVMSIMESIGGYEDTVSILRFIDRINIGSSVSYIGSGTAYTAKDVLYLTIPPVLGILGFTGLSLWRFNKKDLK